MSDTRVIGVRALESPRLRSYLLGQLGSLTGTWIQQVTIALLAFRMTRSSAAVGMALAFSQLPILMLSPLAGALNDRFDRRRVLICTQLASLVQALILMASYHAAALHIALLFTLTIVVSGGNMLLQQNVPEAMRGRVLGLFVMLFNGVAPIGALIWGIVGDHLGIPTSLAAADTITAFIVVARCGIHIRRR